MQKCASTWLHRILAEHPEISMPPVKEINFFSHYYDHGYAWYEDQFSGYDLGIKGEISTSYFYEPAVPARVAKYLPEIKVLVSFRDPIQRAMSNHRHEIRVGHFCGPDLSLEAGLKNNPMYIHQGLYATHLRKWLEVFPQRQIMAVFQEEIESDPSSVATAVFEFLGVDPSFRPDELTRRYNRSFSNKSAGLLRFKNSLYRVTRTPGLRWLWSLGSSLGIRSLYRRANIVESSAVIPEPDPVTIKRLREVFGPEIRDLSKLVDRPLDVWLK